MLINFLKYRMIAGALMGKYYAHMGDREKAMACLRTSVEVLEKKKCRFFTVGIPRIVHLHLLLLFHLGAGELLQRMLDATVKWDHSTPILKQLREEFTKKLTTVSHP